jgi:long-subunit fatty acid transport protein
MFICSGLTAAPGQSLSSSYDFLATSFYHNDISNLDVTKDTSVFETGVNGKIKMPSSIGLGLSLGKTNRWLLAADVQYTQWSSYKFFGSSDSLKNTLRVTFGGQYKPSAVDIGSYWKRINYRAGIRFEESFLELKNKKLNEIGVSVGFSLPLKKSRSTLNFAFETGTFGTIDNLLIKENFFKISVGASLYEKWFIKRKYD